MGGEINMGGMHTDGVNQHSISGGTLDDIEKCWKEIAPIAAAS